MPSPPMRRARFEQDLDTLIRARYPLIWLVSWEEQRVEAILDALAEKHGKAVWNWTSTRGLHRSKSGGRAAPPPSEQTDEPLEALRAIGRLPEPSIVILKDFQPYLDDPRVVRAVRDLGQQLKTSYTTLILLSPQLRLPPELEKDVTVLDVPLPDFQELAGLLKDIVTVLGQGKRVQVSLTRPEAEQLVRAAQGLTLAEAENAFAKAVATDEQLTSRDIALIHEEKRQLVRKSGVLEYFAADASLKDVGGLSHLKQWLGRRNNAFSDAARKFGLPEPKGLLLLGVQGCGKSLVAKTIASQWNLPMLRLDLGRIYSGLVGSSEENLRKAIAVAESVSPAVLWVDELEKGLAGVGGQSNDTGVSARVFGALLTWLQEKTAPVFVVATANKIEALPPELLRKGRFDEIFFIDLPTAAERRDIFEIHLRRRGRDPARFDVGALAHAADGFSGAEIEQAIIAGLYDAFADGTELSQHHVAHALQETVPLSRTMRENIVTLRSWAKERARPASTAEA